MNLRYLETIHSNCYQRCYNRADPSFPYYGARGVKMSSRWLGRRGVANFIKDVLREIGPRPEGELLSGLARYQLDRFPDIRGHYRPGNIRWSTVAENQAHKRPRRKDVVPAFVNSKATLIEQRV